MDSIWSSVLQQAGQNPQRAAILDIRSVQAVQLSYKSLVTAVVTLAHEFSARQYETVALYASNSADWIVVDLACRLADVVLLPLPGFFSSGQIRHALETVSVDAVLTDRSPQFSVMCPHFSPAKNLSVGFDVLHNNGALQQPADGFDNASGERADRSVLREQVLPPYTRKITFTSGSTGAPKGVCLSAEHQLQTARALSDATAELSVKKHLCVLPLSTLLENIAGVYVPLLQGACIVIASDQQLGFNGAVGFSVPDLLHTIQLVAPDSMILMPQLLQALVVSGDAGWKAPDSLRFIAVGGGSVHRLLLDKAWQQGLPVYEGYGLSECGSVVALNTPANRRNGSLGKPLPHVRTRIIDGELYVGESIFLGYAGETDSWTGQHSDAWVATGDLVDTDTDGYLYFQGRQKNLVVSSYGRNISPEWVEREIGLSPLIAQVIVSGDNRPFCVALIAARNESVSNTAIQQLVDEANSRLPEYARVRRWLRLQHPLMPGAGNADDLMTSNGRPRREHIEKYFQTELDAFYIGSEEILHAI